MTFQQLGVIDPILRALIAEGYTHPTPIQEQSIPILLQGKDLLGCAQTGTGKTAAFAIPILQHLYLKQQNNRGFRKIKALIVTPTRELAIQIGESFSVYGKFTGLKNTVIFGGVKQGAQTKILERGIDILVATPGRLLDLIGQGFISLKDVEYSVLDEADRMLDMGFIHDIRKLIALLPAKRQSLFFSATMPPDIVALSRKILGNPEKVSVTPNQTTAEKVDQAVYFVSKPGKTKLLIHLLNTTPMESVLVFSRTKHGANKIVKFLDRAGISAEAIHSNKSQTARQRALGNFKSGETKVLVATDIAARGIDVDELSHVVNYDLPNISETYVHRIGRTGRAGASGIALSFCDSEEKAYLRDIEKLIRQKIEVVSEHPFLNYEPEVEAKDAAVPFGLRRKSNSSNKGGGNSRSRRRGPSGRRTP
ncbi:MAG: DEAD/DEAH box helicase [Candidatus Marinimicrobia bacterium]|nr:DEAD/DEAH box helicase [Candidatus Neomarinimicrobiota bacterium]MCF7921463.1 DEAD/DEAH box helicase [Candidatus Neomarinimicrobiota bacterium]